MNLPRSIEMGMYDDNLAGVRRVVTSYDGGRWRSEFLTDRKINCKNEFFRVGSQMHGRNIVFLPLARYAAVHSYLV